MRKTLTLALTALVLVTVAPFAQSGLQPPCDIPKGNCALVK